jgi:putative DNA primase/helicase
VLDIYGKEAERRDAVEDIRPDRLPKIPVVAGRRHEAADAGLAAMHAAGVEFYQRDRSLVTCCIVKAKASNGELIRVPGIMPVTLPALSRALGKSARWEKLNWKGSLIAIDPPNDVVQQIAAMTGDWPFPPLSGVIGTPTLRPDGTLLAAEGYDSATGLVLLAPPRMRAVPLAPSRSEALEALAFLGRLLTEFPFADDASRSVALSMLMTPVLRGALFPAVPLHAATAPAAGTGKSYLQDLASAIATGERCAVVAVAPNLEETEKRLIGAVLAGYPIIALDNCNAELAGDFLCQASERPVLQLRPLGSSAVVRLTNTVTVFANGNNLVVVADLVRRTLICRLDANMENPDERTFRTDPVSTVLADRGRYVAAILTIARAYIAAGKPGLLSALPSYQAW